MRRTVLLFAFFALCFSLKRTPANDCENDVKDPRNMMKPWEKGAWETDEYRNVFPEAMWSKDGSEVINNIINKG